MRKEIVRIVTTTMVLMLSFSLSWAHFGVIIPSDDIISKEDKKDITLQIKFMHPFEGHYMNMEMPKAGWWGFAALNTADFKMNYPAASSGELNPQRSIKA